MLNLLKKINDYRLLTLCLAGLILPVIGYADDSARALEPAQVVTAFHEQLLNAMKSDDPAQRLSITSHAVNAFFRPATIARISLGRNWRALTTSEQDEYATLIAVLISTSYANRFKKFNDQRFTTNVTESLSEDRVRVRTTLTTQTDIVTLDYQLQKLEDPRLEDQWKIYDIVAGGVSDLSLKRSNYSALFKKGGLAAVIADMNDDIAANTPH
ncbi:MAG: phospholipid transport system substrate-binding protein [Candidatus Azotimanducaceae bacterium]